MDPVQADSDLYVGVAVTVFAGAVLSYGALAVGVDSAAAAGCARTVFVAAAVDTALALAVVVSFCAAVYHAPVTPARYRVFLYAASALAVWGVAVVLLRVGQPGSRACRDAHGFLWSYFDAAAVGHAVYFLFAAAMAAVLARRRRH